MIMHVCSCTSSVQQACAGVVMQCVCDSMEPVRLTSVII